MDLDFSPEEVAFRDEVRAFLAEHLPETLRSGAAASPTVFVEPDIGQAWNAILHKKGDVTAEFGHLSHWWKNNGKVPAVLYSSDILTPEMHADDTAM